MAQPENEIGRRKSSRTPLCLRGTFLTSARSFQIEVRDISLTGALVVTAKPISARAGVLSWAKHRIFAQVAWHAKGMIGLSFDVPICAMNPKEIAILSASILATEATSWELRIPEWETRRNLLDMSKLIAGEICEPWDEPPPTELNP